VSGPDQVFGRWWPEVTIYRVDVAGRHRTFSSASAAIEGRMSLTPMGRVGCPNSWRSDVNQLEDLILRSANAP
jgi:hypothetical protein